MIEQRKIVDIARKVATANLSKANVERVFVDPAVDSEGRAALRVTIVLAPGAVEKLRKKGDAVLDTLVQINHRLLEAGEERFSIVEYTTEEELQESDS